MDSKSIRSCECLSSLIRLWHIAQDYLLALEMTFRKAKPWQGVHNPFYSDILLYTRKWDFLPDIHSTVFLVFNLLNRGWNAKKWPSFPHIFLVIRSWRKQLGDNSCVGTHHVRKALIVLGSRSPFQGYLYSKIEISIHSKGQVYLLS